MEIGIEDFQKIDIRIGTIISAEVPEWSHWVIKLTVDFGYDIPKKTIFAGIMKFYTPKDLIGKQMPFVINIAPKKIGPVVNGEQSFSEGMLLAVDMKKDESDEESKPILFKIEEKVPNGAKIR